MFFQNANRDSRCDVLLDEQWLAILGYLADIIENLNHLNLSLQGKKY
jgi:hypothetical protein